MKKIFSEYCGLAQYKQFCHEDIMLMFRLMGLNFFKLNITEIEKNNFISGKNKFFKTLNLYLENKVNLYLAKQPAIFFYETI
jgi:hypothetical protein